MHHLIFIQESIRRRCTRGCLDDSVQRSLSLDDVFLATGFRLHCDGESPLVRPDSNVTVSLASSSSSGVEDEVEDGESGDMKRLRTFRGQKNVTNVSGRRGKETADGFMCVDFRSCNRVKLFDGPDSIDRVAAAM